MMFLTFTGICTYNFLKQNAFMHCANFYVSYFEGGVSSVYLWDLDGGFAGVILIKKST